MKPLRSRFCVLTCLGLVVGGCHLPDGVPTSGTEEAPRSDLSAAEEARTEEAFASHAEGPEKEPASSAISEGPLDLQAALKIADLHHPEIRAARARVVAASGRATQAETWLNPRFEARMESARFEGRTTGDAEYLIGATQTLPIGGRVGAAASVARADEKRLALELEATRRRIYSRVRGAFFALLYSERLVATERELLDTAESGVRIAQVRLTAGEGIQEEVVRAELEAEGARLQLGQAQASLERTRLVLAESMGRPDIEVSSVEGDLYETLDVPSLEGVLERIDAHPELLAASANAEASEARLRLAEVERIPDVDVGLMYRRLEETSTDAFDVGFGIPLPIFNRNEGKIIEARANLAGARAEAELRRTSFKTRARLVHRELSQALVEVSAYRERLLPRVENVLASAEARYRAGDASLAELLPVQRDAARLKLAYLEAVRELVRGWGELKELASWPD